MNYEVQVQSPTGHWTRHSTHESYRDAVGQSDMVRGRLVTPGGCTDREAWGYAVGQQGYEGSYEEWANQDDEGRDAYEHGAAGGSAW